MGLPLVALAGSSMISRQSAALVTAAGFPQWVASSEDEWIARNCALAGDPGGLADFRRDARTTRARSPLMDGPAFARKFEDILRTAVALAGGPP